MSLRGNASGPPTGPSSLEEALRIEKAGTLVMAARMADKKGDAAQTRELIKQALAVSPNDSAALELLGDLFLKQGEQEKAVVVFERGAKHHPRHAAFEEKLGLARLDLAEMESDKLLREQFAAQGDQENWLDKSPRTSALLSLALPGAGQFYNEDYERGAYFLAGGVLSGGGSSYLLTAAGKSVSDAVKSARLGGQNGGLDAVTQTIGGMSAATKIVFGLLTVCWIGVTVWSAWDAARIAKWNTDNRLRSIGIWD